MDCAAGLSRKNRRVILWIYGAALLYFVLKQCYFAFFTGGFPDQMAHLSYVVEMTKNPTFLPDFRALPTYRAAKALKDMAPGLTRLKIIKGSINSLGHPPLYYLLMALLGGVQILPDGSAAVDLIRLRCLNMLLSSATVILAFRLGYTRLKNRSPLVHTLYAMAIATLPMLAYVGASVNNDNLAFLALVIFFTGLLRYQEDKTDLKTYLLIGLGFLIGSFSKLTTALIFLIMLAVVLVMSVIRTRSLKLILNWRFLVTLPCYLLFLAYELYVKKHFGAWQPSLYSMDYDYYVTTVYYVAPENRVPMTFLQYARYFAGGIGYTWSSLYSHDRTITAIMNNGEWGIIYWISVAAAVIAALLQFIRRRFDRVTVPVVCAFLGTLAYHFYSNWTGYPISGYLGALQARYYLALIVPVAYIMCDQIPPLFEKHKTAGRIIAAVLLCGWLAGDALRLVFLYGFPATA